MDCNKTSRVINSETNDQLLKLHFEELTKVRKLRLVLKELKQIDCSKLMLPDCDQVQKSIVLLKIGEYLYLNDQKEQILDINEMAAVNLNYTEKKALRHLLKKNLLNKLQNISNFNLKLHTEVPEVFKEGDSLQNQVLLLEEQRRSNLEALIQMQNRKCNYLKVIAELKVGPYLAHDLEVIYAKALQNQTKVNLLRGYFINELLTRTEHNLKAIREIESYINDIIDKKQDESI